MAEPRRPLPRQFSVLWFGQAVSQLGDYIALFTIPAFVAFEITKNESFFGLVYAAENAPTLLVGFVGGVLLDRFRLRPLLVVTDLLRAAGFLTLAVGALNAVPFQPWMLIVLSLMIGTWAAMFAGGLAAFIPSIVPRERFTAANARLTVTQQISFVVGPGIGGLLVGVSGFTVAFGVNALTFVVSALSLAFLDTKERVLPEKRQPFWVEARQGLSFLWGKPELRFSALAAFMVNFTIGFLESVLVLIAIRILGQDDPAAIASLFIAAGAGGVLGALVTVAAGRRLGLGRSMAAGLFIYGIGFSALTFMPNMWGARAALAIGLIGVPWMDVGSTTIVQLFTPPHLLGRVSAARRAISWGALPAGALILTSLAATYGLQTVARLAPLGIFAAALMLILSPVRHVTYAGAGAAISHET